MRIGPTLYETKCDIVQLGLQEPDSSFIFDESNKIAKTSGKSYFFYKLVQNNDNGLKQRMLN